MSERKVIILAVALTASLCVNAFLIGAGVSKWKQFEERHPTMAAMLKERRGGPEAREKAGLEVMLKRLPQSVQADVRQALEAARPAMEEKRRAVASARREVQSALTATPFDETALRSAMEKQRLAMAEMPVVLQEAFIKAYTGLSPDERRDFVKTMRRAGPRDSNRGDGTPPPPPEGPPGE